MYKSFLLVYVFLFAALTVCGGCEKNSTGPEKLNGAELREDFDRFYHAWAFRQIAVRNYAEALKLFADKNARKKFAEMNEDLWPATDPALGWAFFFDGAVLCPAGGSDKNGPVAFYHCFADVFLVLTFGTGEDGQTVVTDAHVLTGDFVRNKGKTPFKAERHWTGKEVYAPYAVGFSAAETIKAFEGLFPDGEDFRAAFNNLVSAKAREANQISAGKQFMETLADLAGLLSPDKATDTCSSARKKLVEINDRIMAGQMKRILKEADKTPAEHSKELKDLDISAWRNYKTAAYVESGDYGLVMLQSSANPDTYLSLLMKKQGNDMRLSRMDFLSFDRFYEHGESLAREVK